MSSNTLTVVKGWGLRCDDHHFRPEEKFMPQLDLTGRTALVTGGARVVVADLQDDLGEKVADSLEGDGHGFVHLDVTDEGSWENAVTAVASGFGGLDVLVNNAGVEISSLIV